MVGLTGIEARALLPHFPLSLTYTSKGPTVTGAVMLGGVTLTPGVSDDVAGVSATSVVALSI